VHVDLLAALGRGHASAARRAIGSPATAYVIRRGPTIVI